MSGMTKTPLFSRISSAAAVVGPFAPSQMILALMWGAFLRVMTFSVAAGIKDRKSTRLNSSHLVISYAVFCLKKKNNLRLIRVPYLSTHRLIRDQHTPAYYRPANP